MGFRKHHYYPIKFGVKVLGTAGLSKYPAFPENFGVSFSNRPFRINYGLDLIINDNPFRVSEFVAGEWIRVNHIIRPTTEVNYMIIETFLDWYRPYPTRPGGKNYLVHMETVEAFRFKILGKGSSETVAENTTEVGRQLNRRV